jgi:hypothetical protein
MATERADASFFRRCRTITRAYRSPNTPLSWDCATNPDREKSERMDWGVFTRPACPESCTTFKPTG